MLWHDLQLRPEIISFNYHSASDDAQSWNTHIKQINKLTRQLKKYHIKPEVVTDHLGTLHEANQLIEAGHLDPAALFALRMNAQNDGTLTCKNLLNWVDNLPYYNHWSVVGMGAAQLPTHLQAMLLGGHVCTGLKDATEHSKAQLASGNAQLVDRLARFAYEIGRDIASPQEAKAILGIAETNISTESVLAAS